MPHRTQSRQFVTRDAPDEFHRRYPAGFSATDIYATIALPGYGLRQLGSLAAVSISTHRDTFPVTSLASVKVKGFTQGHRTVAGTLVFHTIDRNALTYGVNPTVPRQTVRGGLVRGRSLPDALPLFDINITYVNEAGALSYESLLGVRVLDFGKTMSFESLQPVESYSYMALDYEPMRSAFDPNEAKSPIFTLEKRPKASRRQIQPVIVPGISKTPPGLDPDGQPWFGDGAAPEFLET